MVVVVGEEGWCGGGGGLRGRGGGGRWGVVGGEGGGVGRAFGVVVGLVVVSGCRCKGCLRSRVLAESLPRGLYPLVDDFLDLRLNALQLYILYATYSWPAKETSTCQLE